MRSNSYRFGAIANVLVVAACANDSNLGETVDGGLVASGGAQSNGRTNALGPANGGAGNGSSAAGGSINGGTGNGGNGGSTATGGGPGGGGDRDSGVDAGTQMDSSPGSGGSGSGGSASGGTAGTGGVSSGGRPGTGGRAATGGAPGTGGVATGGSCSCSSTGGAPATGGVPATGGAPGTGGTSSGGATGTGGSGGTSPVLGGCSIYPPDNPWNTRIDDRTAFPPDPNSSTILTTISNEAQKASEHFLHADFGSSFGIPYVVVPASQATVPITFSQADESDPSPYPIPLNAPIEADSDAHVIALQSGTCLLYELDAASQSGSGFSCYSGAKFDLSTNAIRTVPGASCPTSADAAGLPIFAGLVKYDEVATGRINHAIRFTVEQTRKAFVRPGTHYASSITDSAYPPMGMRVRLLSVPSGITGQALVVATALKEYGMILADNGSNWFISGAPDARFDDNDLDQLKTIPESDLEVVQMGKIYTPADCP